MNYAGQNKFENNAFLEIRHIDIGVLVTSVILKYSEGKIKGTYLTGVLGQKWKDCAIVLVFLIGILP